MKREIIGLAPKKGTAKRETPKQSEDNKQSKPLFAGRVQGRIPFELINARPPTSDKTPRSESAGSEVWYKGAIKFFYQKKDGG